MVTGHTYPTTTIYFRTLVLSVKPGRSFNLRPECFASFPSCHISLTEVASNSLILSRKLLHLRQRANHHPLATRGLRVYLRRSYNISSFLTLDLVISVILCRKSLLLIVGNGSWETLRVEPGHKKASYSLCREILLASRSVTNARESIGPTCKRCVLHENIAWSAPERTTMFHSYLDLT